MSKIKRVRFDDVSPPTYQQDAPEQQAELRPQEGPQVMFAESKADIAILGGAAGGGKSYALLMEPLRNVYRTGKFAAVIFRRTTPSITHPGSLWDTAREIYGITPGATPYESSPKYYEWQPGANDNWEGGAKVQFSHLEHEKTVKDWHGSQIPYIGFDELTEFTQYQFWYMLSRNRSTCGVKPYMRCTCNADADSWVAEFIAWWIDQEELLPNGKPNPRYGYPIPERSGVLRWFVRVGDEIKWGNSPDELEPERLGLPRFTEDGKENQYLVKSVTFIPATVYQNKVLMNTNPEYLGTLLSLPKVERERLLMGNWKIKPAAGLHFNRLWVEVIPPEAVPSNLTKKRGWDLAATAKTQTNDPDFTCGTLIGKDTSGTEDSDPYTYILDHQFAQESSKNVERRLKNTATQDGMDVEQWVPQDPAQAGKSQIVHLAQVLDGYTLKATPETGDKLTRFGPFSAQAEFGFVRVVRAPWNERWFSQLEAFPEGGHDDDVDSTSRAFNAFTDSTTGMLDYVKQQANKIRKEKAEAAAPFEKATLEKGGLLFEGPKDVNVLYGLKGEIIFKNEQGYFVVSPKHAEVLRRPTSGFKEVK